MTSTEATLPLFRHGQWTSCPDPLAHLPSLEWDREEEMKWLGYHEMMSFHPGGDDRAVIIEVYGDSPMLFPANAPAAPEYLIDIRMNGGSIETVAADTVMDLMDLLGRWTPVVAAGVVCDDALARVIKAEEDAVQRERARGRR